MYIDIGDIKLSRIKNINNIQAFDKVENDIHIPCLMVEVFKNLIVKDIYHKSNLERILLKFKDKSSRDEVYDKLLAKIK